MADVKVALEELKEESDSGTLGASSGVAPVSRTQRWWIALAAVVVIAATGEMRPIDYEAGPAGTRDLIPAVSPDGRKIAFSRWRGTSSALLVIPFEGGSAKRLASGVGSWNGLAWTPDGKEIIFSTWGIIQGLRRIAVDATDGTLPQRLSGTGDDSWFPAFAASGVRRGVRLAYARMINNADIMRMELSPAGKISGENPGTSAQFTGFWRENTDNGSC